MARQPFIWAAIRAIETISRTLPHRRAVALGGALGGAVCRFSGARAARAASRAERALGISAREAEEIVRGSYRHFGRAAVEFIRLPVMAGRLGEVISVEGEDNMRAALEGGRGAIFLSAHVGCWEYGAAALASRGFAISAIGAEQRDPRVTELIERLRASGGVKPVGKGLDLRAAIECLKRREILCVLLDQDAREAGVVSPFLGLPASTPTGPLRLAAKFNVPIVPAHVRREPDGYSMTLIIEPALESSDGRPFGSNLQSAADACNAAISRWIRETPDQWMWMYPRWATTLGDR